MPPNIKVLNGGDADKIIHRRELVGRFRLQGLSMREIAKALSAFASTDPLTGATEYPFRNPDTGEPLNVATIKSDLDKLKDAWKKSSEITTDQHMARQLAELQEVKRLGFAKNNLQAVLRAIEDEMKLLGTAAPDKTDLTSGGAPLTGLIINIPHDDD
jgi:DNA-binding transcriptional MerR regulator